jgi:hypothetical protein
MSTYPAGTTAMKYSGICNPDGKAHRYVAYATPKTPEGSSTLIAQTAKVYVKSMPVTACGPVSPPVS